MRAAHPANNAVAVPPPAPLAHPVNNAVAVLPPAPLAQPAQQAMPPAQLPVVAEPVNPPSAFTAVNQRLNAVDDNDDLENAGVEATRRPTGSAKKSGRRNLRVLCENRAVHDSPYLSPRSARTEGNGGRDSTEPASRAPAAAEAVSATPYAGDSLSDDDGRVMPPVVSAFRASPELALPPPQPSVLQPLSVDVGAFGIAFDHDPLMIQGLAGSYAAADLGMLPGLSAVAPDALTVDPDHRGSHFYSACCERVAREQVGNPRKGGWGRGCVKTWERHWDRGGLPGCCRFILVPIVVVVVVVVGSHILWLPGTSLIEFTRRRPRDDRLTNAPSAVRGVVWRAWTTAPAGTRAQTA